MYAYSVADSSVELKHVVLVSALRIVGQISGSRAIIPFPVTDTVNALAEEGACILSCPSGPEPAETVDLQSTDANGWKHPGGRASKPIRGTGRSKHLPSQAAGAEVPAANPVRVQSVRLTESHS